MAMENVKFGFNIAKQWSLQKLGKTQASPEDPDIAAMSQEFRSSLRMIQHLDKCIRKVAYEEKALHEARSLLARSIDEDLKAAQSKEGGQEEKKLDARSSSRDSSVIRVDASLIRMGSVFQSIGAQQDLIQTVRVDILLAAIKDITEGEVKAVNECLQVYERMKLNYDAEKNNLDACPPNDGAKRGRIEVRLQEASKYYDNSKVKLREALVQFRKRRDGPFAFALSEYMNAEHQYFKNSAQCIQDSLKSFRVSGNKE